MMICCSLLWISNTAEAKSSKKAKLQKSSKTSPIKRTSYSTRDSRYRSSQTIRSNHHAEAPSARLGVGKLYGLHSLVPDGDATVLGLDAHIPLGHSSFIPVGFSTWKGELDLGKGVDGELETNQYSIGIGSKFFKSPSGHFFSGASVGWFRMDLEASDYLTTVEQSYMGKHLTPFLGATYSINERLALGFESRMTLFFANKADQSEDDEKDDEDEDDSGFSIPSTHFIALSLRL